MADSIGNIAEQTNLLALNAAIEAARAGEQVQLAVNELSQSGQDVFNFMDNNVRLNYEFLKSTGVQYENDSEFMNNISEEMSESSKQMNEVILELTNFNTTNSFLNVVVFFIGVY